LKRLTLQAVPRTTCPPNAGKPARHGTRNVQEARGSIFAVGRGSF